MYLIENNHPAIIPREQFNAVQAERLRRSAGRSPSKKNASTGRTSYASKYALSERLVCGECGTLYRRCTWKRNGKVRIVWRCVSRLDYGTKYCKESPTMDEDPLQQAIMEAINSAMTSKTELTENIMSAMTEEVIRLPNGGMTLGEIQRRREELDAEFASLLAQTHENGTAPYMERFREIAEETAKLKAQQEQIAGQLRKNTAAQEKLHMLDNLMGRQLPQMELYCEIGKVVGQKVEKGAAVMAAEYLRKHYPDVSGFSPRNVRRMRDFYRIYENHPKLRKLAMQIGWIQNVVIMEADLTMELREWYLRAAMQFGWSKSELLANIEAKAHENITLEIDKGMCYNENKPVTSANTTIALITDITQNVYGINRYWDNHRRKHRRRWHTIVMGVLCGVRVP